MMSVPKNLKYTKEHEWIQDLGDNVFALGVTDHAQEALGDIVFVELPDVDDEIATGETLCTVESVKAVSDVYAPFDCIIVEVNEALEDEPEAINGDPYGSWIMKVTDCSDAELLTAEEYEALLEE